MQINVRKTVKINVEILYVVYVRMSEEIILEDHVKSDNTGLIEIRVTCFSLFGRKNPIKVITVKVNLVVMYIQFIYNLASNTGIKRRLVA